MCGGWSALRRAGALFESLLFDVHRRSTRYSMPCPSCVGIGWAMRYKSAMRGDEEEYLEEIWTRVDEIDGVASNPM